jgi:uncharacterized protein (DUF2384 family)
MPSSANAGASPQRASGGLTYPAVVQELRDVGIPNLDIAKATGVKERQVQHWAAGTSKPRDEARDRLVDVHYIARQLSEVYTPEGVEIWLHARNRGLGSARPIDLLEADQFAPVIEAVERLTSGAMG